MASVMAIVSKAVFFELPVWSTGQVAALDRYKSKNAAFANLGAGDAIFLVTVRDNDVLWLISILEQPKQKGDSWIGAVNRTPITDITPHLEKLVLANGDGISAKKGKLGMSLQTPRVLADEDVKLLRKAAPKGKAPAGEALAMNLKKAGKQKRAKREAAELEASGHVPNQGGKVSAAARAMIEAVYAAPEDRALRTVLADKLLEDHHVWGELISLQMDDPKKHKKRIDQIIKAHAGDMCGPIVHLSRREDLELVDGFLAACTTSKSPAWHGVGRKQWDLAATAREWATVERVYLSSWVTPVWWIEKWMKSAPLGNLREVSVNKFALSRERPGDPWKVSSPAKVRWPEQRFGAMIAGLSAAELARAIPTTDHARAALERARAPKPKKKTPAKKKRGR